MTSLTIKTPGDVPAVVEATLGFVPSNSLVIVGVGGGLTARVDLGDEAVTSLAPAAPAWARVMLVVYSTDPGTLLDYEHAFTCTYPAVEVVVAVRVCGDTVHSAFGDFTRTTPDLGMRGARVVRSSREELADHIAATVHTTAEALLLAMESYRAGDGASAWMYLERFTALGGSTDSPVYSIVSLALTHGIDPNTLEED